MIVVSVAIVQLQNVRRRMSKFALALVALARIPQELATNLELKCWLAVERAFAARQRGSANEFLAIDKQGLLLRVPKRVHLRSSSLSNRNGRLAWARDLWLLHLAATQRSKESN